jgi:putative FmdB family regulatory protein
MPNYEYVCHGCNKTFSKILSISEHEQQKIKCPGCGSVKVEQKYSYFNAITSRKSA